jgi:hypothetical protein
MTHYQKLAILLFRVIGAALLTLGVFMAIFAIGTGVASETRIGLLLGTLYALPFMIFGSFFFGLSKKLGRWVCYDFEKESRVEIPESGKVEKK